MGCNSTGCCPNNNLFECSLKRFLLINVDEIVKTIFSRKVAKNAKKKSVNINQLTLRPLQLGVRF